MLVAKNKIAERLESGRRARISDKDALDVLGLLRGGLVAPTANSLQRPSHDDLAGDVTVRTLGHLAELFATPASDGSRMAARAAADYEDPDTIAASVSSLARELLSEMRLSDRRGGQSTHQVPTKGQGAQ